MIITNKFILLILSLLLLVTPFSAGAEKEYFIVQNNHNKFNSYCNTNVPGLSSCNFFIQDGYVASISSPTQTCPSGGSGDWRGSNLITFNLGKRPAAAYMEFFGGAYVQCFLNNLPIFPAKYFGYTCAAESETISIDPALFRLGENNLYCKAHPWASGHTEHQGFRLSRFSYLVDMDDQTQSYCEYNNHVWEPSANQGAGACIGDDFFSDNNEGISTDVLGDDPDAGQLACRNAVLGNALGDQRDWLT